MILRSGMTAYKPFYFAISVNASNADLRTLALAAGWNGADGVNAVINSGVVLSGSASLTGLTISGSFPKGVALTIASGASIAGESGAGGAQRIGYGNGNDGSAGGAALAVSVPVAITNNGALLGGGGGGGSGGGANGTDDAPLGSGVGGNGARGATAATAGTTGGTGTGGTYGGNGGAGGAVGTVGSTGTASNSWINGSGYFSAPGGNGGAAGNAVTGNANITWLATGTRTGPIT